MNKRAFHGRPAVRAFSLVELMAVAAIFMLLIGMAAPIGFSMMEANNVARGGQLLNDQIRMARQAAASLNAPVEVRLIRLGSREDSAYNAVQIWSTQFQSSPLYRMQLLPGNTAISDNTKVSGFFTADLQIRTMPSGARYVAFQISPAGAVTPSADMKSMSLTVLPLGKSTQGSMPNNYVMVQINPRTGSSTTYRP